MDEAMRGSRLFGIGFSDEWIQGKVEKEREEEE